MCGGTVGQIGVVETLNGLSPRVRGNRHIPNRTGKHKRSIPACAGEPGSSMMKSAVLWVYPRVCGGTSSPACSWVTGLGLSPRVRGNPS